MSQELFQLQDDMILISANDCEYADTLTNFQKDYPACPTFNHSFILYNKTLRQYILDSTIETFAIQSDLETILSNIAVIISAKAARNTAVLTLVEAQAIKIAAIDTAAAAKYIEGFTSSANGTTMLYDSDTAAQGDLRTNAVLALSSPTQFAAEYPSGYPIRARINKDSKKTELYLTASQLVTLGSDWRKREQSIKSQVWILQDKVYAAQNIASVDAITVSIT